MTFSQPKGHSISCSPRRWRSAAVLLAFVTMLSFATSAQAQTLKILYSFPGLNPLFPWGNLVRDAAGNLYGTTNMGGDYNGCPETGCGFVFKLDTTGKATILHEFHDKTDGSLPYGLIGDAAGNIAGTAGAFVFTVSAAGKFTSFYPFPTLSDGSSPGSLIRYQGILYGVAGAGGDLNCNAPFPFLGCGNVFMRDNNGNLTVLYNFTGPPDGISPSGLIRDGAGNFYGMTAFGGTAVCPNSVYSDPGCGIAFKLDSTGHETILYTFTGGADGAYPGFSFGSGAAFVLDAAGNLYGITGSGGDLSCGGFNTGCGVLFKLDPTGTETVLHTFTGQPDGAGPNSGLVLDSKGNLYGTTFNGGQFNDGTIFKLDKKGNFTVLHNFGATASDGQDPSTGLISDPAGNLYGMTSGGGSNRGGGTIFELTP
jgi:uncharacterized repeat protein (TIGR03803 family)